MKIALAVLLVVHAVAHLVGFTVPWGLTVLEEMPYRTTLLGGRVDVGDAGIRLVGALWLVMSVAFGIAAIAVLTGVEWWSRLTLWAVILSLLMCVIGWPDSRFGLLVNLLILVVLLVGIRYGWLRGPMPGGQL